MAQVPASLHIKDALYIKDALAHHQAGRLGEAEQLYRRMLAIDPEHADCLHLLGMVLFQTGEHEQAVELIRKAIAHHPTASSYHSNLGNVLQSQGKIQEAEACYRRALEIRPEQAEVHMHLGHVLRAQGEFDAGLACYQQALAIKPQLAEARMAEAMALLLQGNYGDGWRSFDVRWQTQSFDTPLREYPQPLWKNEPLRSGRLLIWGEQGVGDEIMFAGLVPEVAARGIRCVLDCDVRLKPLFARSFPEVEIVSGYDPEVDTKLDIAAHLPSGSLPGLLRRGDEDFAGTRSPYLLADRVQREQFRARYEDGRPLVGIAWHTKNRRSGRSRSIDLAVLAPLLARPDIRWVCLQYGEAVAIESEAAGVGTALVIDPAVNQYTDIDGFAAQVAAMDLVVSIDNSTAHLAAALAVPTWVLLPFAPDWRWLLDRGDSPWYPSMRLFRQHGLGEWESVLGEVQAALAATFRRP